jgi:hypothetical protein
MEAADIHLIRISVFTMAIERNHFLQNKLSIMKKITFFTGVFIFFLISCSTNKNLGNTGNENPESSVNLYGSKFFLKPDVAKAMIAFFKKHDHRFFGKKQIANSWALFDKNLMTTIYNDPNVDSVRCFLAAKRKKGDPTVVLQVKYKTSTPPKGKGAGDDRLYPPGMFYQYFSAEAMCPPPNDCMVEY